VCIKAFRKAYNKNYNHDDKERIAMKKTERSVPETFTRTEMNFFEKLSARRTIFSEYRRFFNIFMLIGVTWGLVFLSTMI